MKEPKNFLARWSRRKREAAAELESRSIASQESTTEPLVPAGTQSQTAQAEQATLDSRLRGNERERGGDQAARPGSGEPVVDLSKLPSIESITAETDIRAFLAPGVPPELTRAALRRAWSADPAIRDYVGLSENAWDFNAPDSAPGFGALQMTDELRRQIVRMLAGGSTETADRPIADRAEAETQAPSATSQTSSLTPSGSPASAIQDDDSAESTQPTDDARHRDALLQRNNLDAALQRDTKKSETHKVSPRSHGGALPD